MIYVLEEPLPKTNISDLVDDKRPRILVMGWGGIAPGVVTATISIVKNLLEKWFHPIGLLGSWEGVQKEWAMGLVDFAKIPADVLEKLEQSGWTCLGPGRGMLQRDEFVKMLRLKEKIWFHWSAVVGGDGTLSGAQALQYSLGPDWNPVCNTVCSIKTIDGDAEGSLAMGFLTAASIYADAVQAMIREIRWEKGIGIIGVYGRDNGHLALRASTLSVNKKTPVITLLPEFPVTREKFLFRVRELKKHHGYVCIVASEGFHFEGEEPAIDGTKKDGAKNKKLLGCVKLLEEIVRDDSELHETGSFPIRPLEPGIMSRSCDPIKSDILLARKSGQAVAYLIEREAWGHVIAMQGTYQNGFYPSPYELHRLKTGNAVTPDLYDPEYMIPRQQFRDYSDNQHPDFHEGNYFDIPAQKVAHNKLMRVIAQGELINHNGVMIPKWAIPPQSTESEWELPTIWSEPIARLIGES